MNIKKVGLIILLGVILFASGMVIFNAPRINTVTYSNIEKLDIVVTNFASYDFVRAIAGDNVNLSFLIGPR